MTDTAQAQKSSIQMDTYLALRMQRLGSIIVLQPWWNGTVAGQSLTCDLETGTLALAEHPPIEKGFQPVFGVLGLMPLEAGPALVVITGIEQVANLRGHGLFRVTNTQVLTDTSNRKWKPADFHFLDLLKKGTDPECYGGSMYFAAGGDPTLTQQRHEEALAAPGYASQSAWSRAQLEFCWNRTLAKPLLDAGLDRFVPTAFMGFAAQLCNLDFTRTAGQPQLATLTLIARRSSHRVGTRQWRRGADLDAHVANFVESEQLLSFNDGAVRASFVQVRGSVPLLWSQAPNLKYKIPIHIAAPSKSEPVVTSHFNQLARRYGRVTAINLANQTGREGKLSGAYAAMAEHAAQQVPGCRLVPFDFHKHCGATNYANLALLWREIEGDFGENMYWLQDTTTGISTTQRGVFRTNCIDTLDRTNVVQGLLARRHLEHVLHRQGVLGQGETLASAFPGPEVVFRVAWADHGDEISRQYAGTGAMKSAFTRTGKRDLAGLLDDGAKSLTRYFLNNFRDGEKQDAMDLVTGAFKVEPGRPAPRSVQGSPALPLLMAGLLIAMAVGNGRAMAGRGELFGSSGVVQVLLPVVAALSIVKLVFAFGARLVHRPSLRPELDAPWAA